MKICVAEKSKKNISKEWEVHKQFNHENTYWLVPQHFEVVAPL